MNLRKTLFALITTVALVGCDDSAKTSAPAVDEFSVKLAQIFVMQDIEMGIQGKKAQFKKDEALAMLGVPNAVSSQKLSRDYKANEVAADEKYKGQRVLVSGRVNGINKDIIGAPFVSLPGASMFEDVSARFPRDSVSELAKYHKGMNVQLVCTVSGLTVMNVSLKDCANLDDYLAAQEEKIKAEVKRFASGEKAKPAQQKKSRMVNMVDGERLENAKLAKLSYYMYLMGPYVPADSQCRNETTVEKCEEDLDKVFDQNKEKIREKFYILYPEEKK